MGGAFAALLRFAVRAALAVAILAFLPDLLEPFHAVKAALLRTLGLPLLLVLAVPALRARRVPRSPLDLVVAVWVLAAAISTLVGVSPRLSWMGELQQREGLVTVLALAGIYAAARVSHTTLAHVRGTLMAALACGAVAAAYAMMQRAGLDPARWENLPLYPGGGGMVVRVFGPLGNPILLGCVLTPILAAGSALAMSGTSSRFWLIPVLMLIATAIAATLSRGAMLAAVAGVGVAALLRWRNGGRDAVPAAAGVVAWVFGTAAAWTAIGQRGPMLARIVEGADPRAESLHARLEIARSALALWRRHPWFGVGPDAFGLTFPAVQTPEMWSRGWMGMPADAHSVILQVLATGGIVMVAIGVVWIVALAARLLGALRAGPAGDETRAPVEAEALIAGCCALAAVATFNTVGPAGATLFVVFSASAMALAPTVALRPDASPAAAEVRPGRFVLAGALGLALILAFLSWREFRALGSAARAHGALTRSLTADPARRYTLTRLATADAQRAARQLPGEDQLWRMASDTELAELRAQQYVGGASGVVGDSLAASAESSARRALALEPMRASNVQRLANALAMRGNVAAADSAFDLAVTLAPYDALILADRVRCESQSGRPERAIVTARRIVSLYPEEATGHAIEAGLWLAQGQRAQAREALDRALAARWEAGSEARREAVRRARASLGP